MAPGEQARHAQDNWDTGAPGYWGAGILGCCTIGREANGGGFTDRKGVVRLAVCDGHMVCRNAGRRTPESPRKDPSAREEVVRAFEVGRIKRSADPALNSDSMTSENQCRIGVAALLDPCTR